MRKMFLLVFIFLLSFTLISCGKETKYIESLSDETENEIKLAAASKYERDIENVEIEYFFGGFGDSYTIILNTPVKEYLIDYTEKIENYDFRYLRHYNLYNTIVVYNNNNFYSLQEVLDNKLLTLDNIKKVKENFDNTFDKYNEEYFKISEELVQEGLTTDIYNRLREVLPYYKVIHYLGEYNGAYVAYYLEYTPQANTGYLELLDWYIYSNSKFNNIRVIYEGKEYNQKEAYDLGILSKENITNIFTKYNGYSPFDVTIKDNKLQIQSARNILKQYYVEVLSDKYPNMIWDINKILNMVNIDFSNNVYNDVIYLQVVIDDTNIEYEEKIDKYVLTFYQGTEYIVYKDGKIYNLKEAYTNKIINNEILENIYNDWFEIIK